MLKYLVVSLLFCSLFSCNNGSLRQQEDLGNKIFDLRQKKENLIKVDDFGSAIEICNEILQLNPKLDTMYVERAICYISLYEGDTLNKEYLKLALNDLSKAISLKPYSNYYRYRSAVYSEYFKNSIKSLKDLDFALNAKNANEYEILEYRAKYYFKDLKDSSNAFNDCKILINNYRDSSEIHGLYADLLADCRRFNEAEKSYWNAIQLSKESDQNWQDLYCKMGFCRIELHDYYGALYCFERARESRMGSDYLPSIGKGYCLYKLGQKELGKNMMSMVDIVGNRPFIYGIPKRYLELFPETEPMWVSYNYDWPN